MTCERSGPLSPEDLLFMGRLDWGGYVERCELERRERQGSHRAGGRVRAVCQDGSATPTATPRIGGTAWENAGKARRGWDTRCRCVGGCWPAVVWLGYRLPLERWCLKCGRALPRPFDRRYLPVEGRDVAPSAIEVGAAELVGVS